MWSSVMYSNYFEVPCSFIRSLLAIRGPAKKGRPVKTVKVYLYLMVF